MEYVWNSNLTGTVLMDEVLIIEDTPESLALLSELILKAGFSVRQAQDGEMGLISARSKLPSIILLDVRMPGINGFEVCKQLKSDEQTSSVPIIFLSALQDIEAKIKGLQLGAADFVTKPYEPDEVLLRVKNNLELNKLRRNLEAMCYQKTKKLMEEMAERRRAQEELMESKKQLRELTGHLQDVREEERRRIAREIHDELGQILTVGRIDLTRLSSRLEEPKENLQRYITDLIAILEQASDTARSISENLRPGMLDLLGLGPALEHHVKRFQESTDIECALKMENEGEFNIDDHVATVAFRIVQEALTNVARYADATQVKISVSDLGKELIIIVQDNGIGMSEENTDKKASFGILGMKERTKMLGGTLLIESDIGRGVRIEVSLPHSGKVQE